MAIQRLGMEAWGCGDNLNVVRAGSADLRSQLNPRKTYSGFLRSAQAYPGAKLVQGLSWVPGHLREKLSAEAFERLDDHTKWAAAGNEAADEAADRGRRMHPEWEAIAREQADRLVADLRVVYRVAATVLRLWPGCRRA